MILHKTHLSQLIKLSLIFSLALSLWLALAPPPAYAQGPCFVETSGDNITDFESADAGAVQAAVDVAAPGDTLRIAGTCAGVQETAGHIQTVYISKSLTLQGGYNQADWAAGPQPGLSATLDAGRGGRVVVAIGGIEVTLDRLIITGGGGALTAGAPLGDSGAGIWTNSALTLTHSSVISNLITPGSGNDGAGIYNLNGTLTIADSRLADNENGDDDGGGIHLAGGSATIVRSTLQNNRTQGDSNNGGAIYLMSGSVLQISDSQILDNYTSGSSASGGAIRMTGNNAVTITNSTLSGNSTAGLSANGGVIYATGGTVFIDNSVIQDNHTYGASANGGGIAHLTGVTTINNSAILDNSTADATGGGLYIGGGTMNISNSTIAHNHSLHPDQAGGGLGFNQFGDNQKFVTLENVTMSGNSSAGEGGGIWVPRGFLTMTHVTLSDNSAGTSGGGISARVNGTVTMANSIIANSANGDCLNAGSFNDLGYNLVEDGSCLSFGTSLTGDPLLAPLADNGGPAQTHALLAGSPAIDASPGDNCALSADQRGISRPQGSGCDSGAFEAEETNAAGPLCYVHASATGANNGASWTDAYTDLQVALLNTNCTEIWVAAGTYYPTTGADRTATFQLKSGVAIYGGFTGLETARDQRNPDPATNNTLLSGDIGAPADNSDNSYHVVTGSGADNSAVLDGFTVTAGQTDGTAPDNRGAGIINNGGSPTLTNVIISNNRTRGNGAGMVNINNSSPVLTNVSFNSNYISTDHNGGGMFNAAGSSPVLVNVLFSKNEARSGGGMFNNGVSPRLTNVTFSGNTANQEGGGMFNANDSNPTLTNVTFSGNTAFVGGGMVNGIGSPTLINVIIANNSGGDCVNLLPLNPASANNLIETADNACGLTDGVNGNIIGADPNLGPLAGNGGAIQTHALLPGSPAIDAGDDASCPATDQRGLPRPRGAHCDIGAFEAEAFYTLSVNVVGSGAVSPTGGSYLDGTLVSLEAIPAAGWQFGGWSGDLSGSANPVDLTMDGDKVITATFSQIPTYTLTVNITGEGVGSVSLDPPGGSYNAGTIVTLTATAGDDSYFGGWSGDLNTANSPKTLTMDGDKIVTATFDLTNTVFLPLIYTSFSSNGRLNGLTFADEDILAYDPNSDSWSKQFDGSDVGLSGADLDAFYLLAEGSLLLSLDRPIVLSGLGLVDDSDIVRFIPSSLGENTAGGFEWYFDGSDVGLTWGTEDVDNISFTPDGKLLISTIGPFAVPWIAGRDEDLITFTATRLGQNTSGVWTRYFDGSDIGLRRNSEDVRSAWIDPANGDIYLTTKGNFSVANLSGDGSDIFICHPVSLGVKTICAFSFYWDGSAHGLAGKNIDAFTIGGQVAVNVTATTNIGLEVAEVELSDTPEEEDISADDAADENDSDERHALDDISAGADDSALYFPLIFKTLLP